MAVKEIIRNKKYRIDIPIGYNGNKRIRHIETFEGLKSEAVLRENELKLQLKNNTFVKKNKMTMEDLIKEWLEYSETKLSPKTLVSYKLYTRNIIKCIGHIKLQNLNTKILEDFYKELRTNTTYSDKTIQHHYTIISTALNKAIVWGYIQSNQNANIEKPKVKKKEIKCYSPEEVDLLINALQSECLKYQALILLALDTGCRRGEITGLTWEDIDFTKRTISVNKASVKHLSRHPYLRFEQAKAIYEFRRKHVHLDSIQQLRELEGFDEELLQKLTPYLSFDKNN